MVRRIDNFIVSFLTLLSFCFSSCDSRRKVNEHTIQDREDILILNGNIGLVERGEGVARYFSFAEIYLTNEEEDLYGIRFEKIYLGSVEGVQKSGDSFVLKGQEPQADPFDNESVVFHLFGGIVEKVELQESYKFESTRIYFDRCKKNSYKVINSAGAAR